MARGTKAEEIAAYMREIGSRGGKARAANLDPDRRREIALGAARAAQARRERCNHPSTRTAGTRTYCARCGIRLANSK